jgi:type I restriction enzyme S subunit
MRCEFASQRIKLSDICTDINYGYTASADAKNIGPKFLRITDIQGGVVSWDTVPYCQIEKSLESKYLLQRGDIVVARTGNSTGENHMFTRSEKVVFASYLIRFRINQEVAFPHFIWYQMRSSSWWNFINSSKTGSAQAGANAKVLGMFEVILPSLSAQIKIASVLQALDNRIALLHETNVTLEAIAQALFKSWFVDFDPVRAKAEGRQPEGMDLVTRDLFPSRLILSSLGDIPEGWEIGRLDKITTIQGGFAFKSKDFKDLGNPVIKIKNINTNRTVNSLDVDFVPVEIASKAKRFELNDGDLLMAMTGATVGKFGLLVNMLEMKCLLNQRVARFVPHHRQKPWFI